METVQGVGFTQLEVTYLVTVYVIVNSQAVEASTSSINVTNHTKSMDPENPPISLATKHLSSLHTATSVITISTQVPISRQSSDSHELRIGAFSESTASSPSKEHEHDVRDNYVLLHDRDILRNKEYLSGTDKRSAQSMLSLDTSSCVAGSNVTFTGTSGAIHGLVASVGFQDTTVVCDWRVRAPEGTVILYYVTSDMEYCWGDVRIATMNTLDQCPSSKTMFWCHGGAPVPPRLWFSSSNIVAFRLTVAAVHMPRFTLHFQALPEQARCSLQLHKTSPTSGFVTTFGFDGISYMPCRINASYDLALPDGHVVMVSFPHFQMGEKGHSGSVEMLAVHNKSYNTPLWKKIEHAIISARVYYTDLVIRALGVNVWWATGFKMLYTFHNALEAPRVVSNGKFNCSEPDYASYRQHLDCNLEPECHGGEDEPADCPYTSPACHGTVGTSTKCYRYVSWGKDLLWDEARSECQKLGGDLAMMKTKAEWDAFRKLFQFGKRLHAAHVGLRSSSSTLPDMYRRVYTWVDGTVSYNMNITHFQETNAFNERICTWYGLLFRNMLQLQLCDMNNALIQSFVCESETYTSSISVSVILFPVLTDSSLIVKATNQTLIQCPGGHVSHVFLYCDPDSFCGTEKHFSQCATPTDDASQIHVVTMTFACEDGKSTVPYTLVCDFRPDCADRSDEEFCRPPGDQCVGFRCHNGQCVKLAERCDRQRDCWDGSDEACSTLTLHDQYSTYRLHPPAVVHFDASGNFTQQPWYSSRPCPETHFRCPDGYCLPVYLRCNGVLDCPGREDEADCQTFTCPGFYRCRASRVCVHVQHLCDGWPQCPQHDDELLCQAACPQGCSCQGLSFVCPQPFPADSFPDVRYLDASGSGMTAEELTQNVYLVWLSLASCQLDRLLVMDFPNLRSLDLSRNNLTSVDMGVFLPLQNLRVLFLAENPLVYLINAPTDVIHRTLQVVDLSHTNLETFGTAPLSNYPSIITLNLSYSKLDAVSHDGFLFTPHLQRVDLRGNTLTDIPSSLLKGLSGLRFVMADNFKLCCRQMLPDQFGDKVCSAPQDEISSCQDLLRSDVYRVFLWVFSVLSVTGNVGCVLSRMLLQRHAAVTGFSVFVSNLSLADFLMGVYLALVGAADTVYRGQYLWFDNVWKTSVMCKVAGFLSLLSSEVSALMICLITLDRFLVLRFPFSMVHFRRTSACVACGIAWTMGFVIAAVPLLPVTSEWRFYSQSGICIPLPITRKSFRGRDYAFAVMIVLNLVLFLLIAAGQVVIYWTIRVNSMQRETSRKSKEMVVARRLTSIVVSDFLCWFPIGVLGLLASTGTPVPSEVNVGMAIFVLPFNSALNPFLYTFNTLLDRWRRAQEELMLKQLESLALADRMQLS